MRHFNFVRLLESIRFLVALFTRGSKMTSKM